MKKLAQLLAFCALATDASPVLAHGETSGGTRIAYDLDIAGLPIGWGVVELALQDDGRYQIDIGMKLEILFWRAGVAGSAEGKVEAGDVKPGMCSATVLQAGKVPVDLFTDFESDTVLDWAVTPKLEDKYEEGCVPLGQADIERTLDPLSALFVYSETAAEACDRTIPIFAFGTRLDLMLTPGVEIETGIYSCNVRYRPIAGHREESESVQILLRTDPRLTVFEIKPGLWAPHQVGLPTRLGSLTFTHQAH